MEEIEDLADVQAFVQAAFRVLGLAYDHPRVVAFIARVEAARVAKGLRDFQPWRGGGWRHTIDPPTYRSLAINLAKLLLAEREALARQAVSEEERRDLVLAFKAMGGLKTDRILLGQTDINGVRW